MKLYLIPTPIGNLEDITLRALRILKEVDMVFCEDTRTTGNLLRHYGIEQKCYPFHIHNEHQALDKTIAMIKSASSVALTSDAGTPAISDPGFLLVRECLKEGIDVECLPGATALIPAIVNSGLPCDSFYFYGFLPHKKGKETALRKLAEMECTVVFYESPYRLVKTLEMMQELFGLERRLSVARELTKIHEENFRGSVAEALQYFAGKTVKGEIVVVVNGCKNAGGAHTDISQ